MKIDLLPLETLVNFVSLNKKDVFRLECSYRAYYGHPLDESIVYKWLVTVSVPLEGTLIAKTPSLQEACINLIEAIQGTGYEITWATTLSALSNSNQLEKLILQLQQLTRDKVRYALFIAFSANSPDEQCSWEGLVKANSHWSSGYLAKVETSSLYEVCTQLVEPFQQLESK
jgi:hypothetical protein